MEKLERLTQKESGELFRNQACKTTPISGEMRVGELRTLILQGFIGNIGSEINELVGEGSLKVPEGANAYSISGHYPEKEVEGTDDHIFALQFYRIYTGGI